MENLQKRQRKTLEELKKIFDDLKIAAQMRDKEKEELPMDVLTTLHTHVGATSDEVLGEYFFFPPENNPVNVQYFGIGLTLSENVTESFLPQLISAVGALNYYVFIGAFTVDVAGGKLVYKLTVPMSVDLMEEEMTETANIAISSALTVVETYTSILLRVAEGEAGVDELMEFLPVDNQ